VAPTQPNVSAIILTIVSALSLGTCVVGIPSLIFGVMALTSNTTDPVGARQKARTGWIIFAINAAVALVFLIILAVVVPGIFLILLNNVPSPSVKSGI
jgi:hypothetical protein